MPLIMAVARERAEGEFRTALVPETAKKFAALGASLRMEQSAAIESHFLDPDFADVTMVDGIAEAYASAGLILRVTPPSPEEIAAMAEGSSRHPCVCSTSATSARRRSSSTTRQPRPFICV